MLVLDETGDCKKGTATVGTQRHYTGTAGKIDNAQIAVYLTYASRHGHAVIDQELYLPKGWVADADRRHAAGVPEQVGFATKPELARVMLERALTAGVPAAWVTADEVYGINPGLGCWLETQRLGFVLAIRRTDVLQPAAVAPGQAADLAARVPGERWLRINAGDGAKGRRWYAWTRMELAAEGVPAGWGRWLLVRRNLRSGELAFYVCAGPPALPWPRWCGWPAAAGESRSPSRPARGCAAWTSIRSAAPRSWYRWATLSMLAYAFLAVARPSSDPGILRHLVLVCCAFSFCWQASRSPMPGHPTRPTPHRHRGPRARPPCTVGSRRFVAGGAATGQELADPVVVADALVARLCDLSRPAAGMAAVSG